MKSYKITLLVRILQKDTFRGILELTSNGIQFEDIEKLPKKPSFFNRF